jgi:hypothetical protein
MQNNNYEERNKILFDEPHEYFDKHLFLTEKQKKSEDCASDVY